MPDTKKKPGPNIGHDLAHWFDQAEADLYELLLIRRYDPERNTAGRREELEARMRGHTRGGFTAGHKYSTREFLDSRQEQD